jgi:hypothetical protein
MLRLKNEAQSSKVKAAFELLTSTERSGLMKELRMSGVDDGWAILLYHTRMITVYSTDTTHLHFC